MGYYRTYRTVALPEPADIVAWSWVVDDADTDFAALVATGRSAEAAGTVSTGELTVGAGGQLTIGIPLDTLTGSLGAGVFEPNSPSDGLRRRPFGFGLAIAKAAGETGGGGDTDLTLGTWSASVAGAAAVAASGTLTATGQPSADQTVTLGTTVYTFKLMLADPFDIQIGATASDTLDNLIAAVNLDAGEGTLYGTGTTIHPTVSAAPGSGDTAVFTAKTAGTAGNSIATTDDASNMGFAAGTLTGGAAATARVLTGSETFEVASVAATTASALADLDQLTGTLDAGLDTIALSGKTPDNSDWSGVYTYANGDTLGDLCARIEELIEAEQAASVGVTVTGGKIVITDTATGISATSLTATFTDIEGGSYVSALRLDKVTSNDEGELTRTTVGSATPTGSGWLVGPAAAEPTAIPVTFTPALVQNGALELVIELTLAASDTAEFVLYCLPGSHYLLLDLEGAF